jgi:hypothetical protein
LASSAVSRSGESSKSSAWSRSDFSDRSSPCIGHPQAISTIPFIRDSAAALCSSSQRRSFVDAFPSFPDHRISIPFRALTVAVIHDEKSIIVHHSQHSARPTISAISTTQTVAN